MTVLEEKKRALTDALDAALQALDFELADVVLSQYKHNFTVRVFVYGAGGVTIDDCAKLSHSLGDVIDGLDLFADGYALEVSSPGLDRPLTTARDFKYRLGETIKVVFVEKSRRSLVGEIVEARDTQVVLVPGKPGKSKKKSAAESADEASADKSDRVVLDLADIEQASIVF